MRERGAWQKEGGRASSKIRLPSRKRQKMLTEASADAHDLDHPATRRLRLHMRVHPLRCVKKN